MSMRPVSMWVMKFQEANMEYTEFKGLKLSALGFGAMRLPQRTDGGIDQQQVEEMVAWAISHGINYFDTAAPYHGGNSEKSIGQALAAYPRNNWYLADKYPGHQHSSVFNPAETFERQLRKCGVDYFDFYLFHNISENCLADYMDPRWGILDYFTRQKALGRIKHLGMSSHASPETLRQILDGPYGQAIEFCQIQLNYLDWTLQDAREKVRILNERHIPIWVMEPVRGGKLCHLKDEDAAALKSARPDESPAAWAFRWLKRIPGVTMILSGMSNLAQMADNISTFEHDKPLNDKEIKLLEKAADRLSDTVPCTACRYCCDGCPSGLDIPSLLSTYNDLKLEFSFTPVMYLETLPPDKLPQACVGCGACAQICPQSIPVPQLMTKLSDLYEKSPKWSDICVERNRLAEKSND